MQLRVVCEAFGWQREVGRVFVKPWATQMMLALVFLLLELCVGVCDINTVLSHVHMVSVVPSWFLFAPLPVLECDLFTLLHPSFFMWCEALTCILKHFSTFQYFICDLKGNFLLFVGGLIRMLFSEAEMLVRIRPVISVVCDNIYECGIVYQWDTSSSTHGMIIFTCLWLFGKVILTHLDRNAAHSILFPIAVHWLWYWLFLFFIPVFLFCLCCIGLFYDFFLLFYHFLFGIISVEMRWCRSFAQDAIRIKPTCHCAELYTYKISFSWW